METWIDVQNPTYAYVLQQKSLAEHMSSTKLPNQSFTLLLHCPSSYNEAPLEFEKLMPQNLAQNIFGSSLGFI